MKKIVLLFLFLVSCKQLSNNNFSQENIIANTLVQKTDIIKISKPFNVNDIECYWIYSIIDGGEIIMDLKEYKTDRILLGYSGYREIDEWDYKQEDFFDKFNQDVFKDINFDGFKDFLFQNYGSTLMNNSVGIFIFDNITKTFEEFTDDYSTPQSLIKIDSVNKRLITGNDFRFGNDSIIYYFDKNGKLKFTEVFTNYVQIIDTTWINYKDYRKIINGKIIETKTDSIINNWE